MKSRPIQLRWIFLFMTAVVIFSLFLETFFQGIVLIPFGTMGIWYGRLSALLLITHFVLKYGFKI